MRLALSPFLLTATVLVFLRAVGCLHAINDDQQPLQALINDVHGDDQYLLKPLASLSELSDATYTTISHRLFPQHKVRLKRTTFCNDSVEGYTGYIDISEARHIFFYFFPSSNANSSASDSDPIVFWTNGGPGCSSAVGMFLGIGPCRMQEDGQLERNEFAWNRKANMLFVDQPVGVGFSYAEFGESVATTEEAAKDIAAFITIFFENFTQFRGRALHMAGESYAGRYIPLFAAEIYDQNKKLVQAGITPINLTSVIIGNGLTHPWITMSSYYDMQCTNVSHPYGPVLDIQSCVRMKQILPRCERWTGSACIDTFDAVSCKAAFDFCFGELFGPYMRTGLNPNDMSKPCPAGMEETLCYPILQELTQLLNDPMMRTHLGVDPNLTSNFSACSIDVEHAFQANLDPQHISTYHIEALLERGIKVLSYVGENDFICNWVGNERWVNELVWSGREEFGRDVGREWFVGEEGHEEQGAGIMRSGGSLTYATVRGAGHMVPYDKPKEVQWLVERWITGEMS